MRCNSDTQPVISHCEEAAITPLGVASPQIVQGVSENEVELPTVTDCTTLALVDAAQGESVSLIGKAQDCGVEPKDCHKGACSAASVVQNEKSLNSAIANQTQRQGQVS
ncbi:hypothetical protein [Nostoc sp. TCL240-02]|uniref:hypothetical protein n=1 Tax=Nostoc sp. TCL240-02 TaxID=2572090 RepID=UPI00157F881E|nr:hypothetical protein [Nostoc sp. TCL240-02]QKQ73383.1 hypothetical protein FBB35_08455 [Nostoc sp. TCL240-02]